MQNGDTIIWAADFLLSSGFGGWKWEASCKFVFRDLCVSNALSIDKRSHSCHTSSWFRFLPSRSSCKSLPIFVVTAVVVVLIRKFEHTPKYFKKQAQWIETGFVWFIHHSDSFGGHINRTNLTSAELWINKPSTNEHEWTDQKVCGKSIHRLVALRPLRGRLRLCPNTWPPLRWHSAIRELTVATALRHLLLFCRQHCYRFMSERLTQMRVAILPRPQKGRTCFCMLHSRFQQAPFLAWQWADC